MKNSKDFEVGYRSGYGQAKADLLKEIVTALRLLYGEAHGSCGSDAVDPTDKQRQDLVEREKAMRWVRTMIATLK